MPEDRPSVLEKAGEIGLAVAIGAVGIKVGQVGATAEVVSPRAYSVAFEAELATAELGLSRARHFQLANEALAVARAKNPVLAELAPNAVAWGRPPSNWVWQHATIEQAGGRAGVLQLVPKSQHTPGSPFWRLLHPLPGGGGGYTEWAIPAGSPPN